MILFAWFIQKHSFKVVICTLSFATRAKTSFFLQQQKIISIYEEIMPENMTNDHPFNWKQV